MDEIEVKKPSRRIKRDAPKYKQVDPVKPSRVVHRVKRDLTKIQVAPITEVAPVADTFESATQNCVNVEYQPVAPVIQKPKLTPIVKAEPIQESHKGRGFLVGLTGAGIVGYMGFEGIKLALLDKGYTDDQAKQYASISAGVCSLITFMLLYKIAK